MNQLKLLIYRTIGYEADKFKGINTDTRNYSCDKCNCENGEVVHNICKKQACFNCYDKEVCIFCNKRINTLDIIHPFDPCADEWKIKKKIESIQDQFIS